MHSLQSTAMNLLYVPRGSKIEPAIEMILVTSDVRYDATAAGLARAVDTDTIRFLANSKSLRQIIKACNEYLAILTEAAKTYPELPGSEKDAR